MFDIKTIKRFTALFVVAAVSVLVLNSSISLAQFKDQGNAMERKQKGLDKKPRIDPERKELYDVSQRVIITSTKAIYEPGEKPVLKIYLMNNSKETRHYLQLWSPTGAGGVYMRAFLDGREIVGSTVFNRESVGIVSESPDNAIRLDPGQKKHIMNITFSQLDAGDHTFMLKYASNVKINEPMPRNWWRGITKSNEVTLKVSRVIADSELQAAATKVIKAIHADIAAAASDFDILSGYMLSSSTMQNPPGAMLGIPVINYSVLRPARAEIRIYFEKLDYEPSTLALFDEAYPYLGIKLFAHIDTGGDMVLRNRLLKIIDTHKKSLYAATRDLATKLRIEIEPFGPEVSKKLRRAAFIIHGTVNSKYVEDAEPHEYTIRKWVLDVKVNEVFHGDVRDSAIKIKSGAIATFFGDEEVMGKDFIILMGDKNNWQEEFTLVGVEPANDSLIEYLRLRF